MNHKAYKTKATRNFRLECYRKSVPAKMNKTMFCIIHLSIDEKKREKYSIESSEKFSIGFSKLKGKPEQDQCYPNAGEMDNTSDGICKETVPTPKSAGKSEQYPIMENCSIDR